MTHLLEQTVERSSCIVKVTCSCSAATLCDGNSNKSEFEPRAKFGCPSDGKLAFYPKNLHREHGSPKPIVNIDYANAGCTRI